MNIAFYGHARSVVYTYTVDGIFNEMSVPGGMRFIYQSVTSPLSEDSSVGVAPDASIDDEYRRDYFSLRKYTAQNGRSYYAVGRYLGCREGKVKNSIFSAPPQNPDAPTDLLVVWDEGYGGLDLPYGSNAVFWASDRALPSREQFAKIAGRCFLYLDADVLRAAGAMVSRQISWERTATELMREIQQNSAINYLLDAQYIFISFAFDGGVFIARDNDRLEAALILTHGGAEGETLSKTESGTEVTFAATSALFVAQSQTMLSRLSVPENAKNLDVFSQIVANLVEIDELDAANTSKSVLMGRYLRGLLEAGEAIILTGYQVTGEKNNDLGLTFTVAHKDWEAFAIPLEAAEGGIMHVPDDWIVTEGVGSKQIYDVAFEYVREGAKVIDGLPQLSFGAFTTVDRWEIESYQNIRNLILQYAGADSVRPLSIAVFGSPGSGKSFGVTQIAKNILPGKVEKLEFNVSQFLGPSDLAVAFQKVRDVILEGKLPLVFFDEFDSDKEGIALGWVKSFLMPMQDGRFRDASGEHPLGKCILVFAGGTAPNFEEFIAPMTSEDADMRQDFKNVKGPDFISRLKGTINVLGPNPKNEQDKNHILRRALLLRGLCERKLAMEDGRAPISPAIIRAMLQVPEYKHGARSMEAIMDMSRIEDGIFEPAALPFHSQLALHVDADVFLELVLQNEEM